MTEIVPSPEDRDIVGIFFVGIIALNICTHLYFLFADVFAKLFKLIRSKCDIWKKGGKVEDSLDRKDEAAFAGATVKPGDRNPEESEDQN